MLENESRESTLGAELMWRRKYRIEEKAELYYEDDFKNNPWFTDTIVHCRGYLEAGLYLPLSPLEVSFFNNDQ